MPPENSPSRSQKIGDCLLAFGCIGDRCAQRLMRAINGLVDEVPVGDAARFGIVSYWPQDPGSGTWRARLPACT